MLQLFVNVQALADADESGSTRTGQPEAMLQTATLESQPDVSSRRVSVANLK